MLAALVIAAIIPPGHEAAISALFRDLPLGHGCRVTAIRVSSDQIAAPMACDDDRAPMAILAAPETAPEPMRTAHFGITIRGDAPAGLTETLVEALRGRDTVDVWAAPALAPAGPTPPPAQSWLIGVGLAIWPLVELVRWRRRRSSTL